MIRQAIVEDIMDKEIKNPKTGNKIKVRTALQLPDEHPANKKAKDMVAKTPTDDKSKKKKGFLSKLNPFSKKDDEPKEKPDSLVPDKPSFLGGDTKVGEKAEQTHDRVGEFIDDNEGNIPEEYVDKLKDLQKRASDIGLSIFNNDGRAPEGTTNKIKELDAEAQEMMDDIEQKAMDGEFDDPIKESKQRRYTVKEVRMWMKKLEENRYKKVYNSDARRVAWMVNNEGRTLDEMPMSMKKKWSKAQYGRERYLATEFLKSKSEQLSEGLDLKKLETAIKDFQNKIKKQGRVTNARDEDHLKQLIKVYKQMGGKKIKEGKLTEASKKWSVKVRDIGYVLVDAGGASEAKRLVAKKLRGGIKDILGVTKALPSKKVSDVGEEKLREQIREIIKEQLNEQKFKKVILPNDMKTKVKVSKIIKKMKLKIDKDYDVKALKARGGDQVISILPKHYNKFIELAMKNKLNPRG